MLNVTAWTRLSLSLFRPFQGRNKATACVRGCLVVVRRGDQWTDATVTLRLKLYDIGKRVVMRKRERV